jgi:hypothetical protein
MDIANTIRSDRKKPGAKPQIDGVAMRRTEVTIDDKTRRLLLVLGNGNLSLGVREAASVAYERYQRS